MFCSDRCRLLLFLLFAAIAYPVSVAFAAPQQTEALPAAAGEPSAPLGDIVKQLDLRTRERNAALRKFEGTRVYRMRYQGFFGIREAEMVVQVRSSPGERQFTVESQTGSKFIIEHIFEKLLDGEKESTTDDNRRRTALNTENYTFTFSGLDTTAGAPAYVLKVLPKTDEKFLYRGKIWVDANDFAVSRIEAEPAKSPSVWIKKAEINHKYEKIDQFWLPVENRTESSIRFGGHALLSIEYKDYKITETSDSGLNASARCESSCGAQ